MVDQEDRIIKINIEDEMKSSYIDYSMSVIVSRALPDVRDGFKPVHRRILYGMSGLSNTHDKPHKKSARIVGEVLGKYHPHGDSSVYNAMVRLAQEWSMRYTLVDGQGNIGSVDGDSPAAMRYTEARLNRLAEEMLRDIASSDDSLAITSLRYFNPIGAHPSGLIGENPNGVPNNLMPYITQVAVGKRAELGVFGDDYDTVDGTGVRDYIHVDDLAEGHVAALTHSQTGYCAINLGSGEGTSVLELVRAFEEASGAKVPYKIHPRRPGDVAVSYAKTARAADVLQWRTTRTIEDACRDSWRWQSGNPEGNK